MFEGLGFDVTDLSGWSAASLIGFYIVVSFIRGRLYSKAAMDDVRLERDTLRDALNASWAASREKDAALIELLQLSRTSATLLEKLQETAALRRIRDEVSRGQEGKL